MITYTILGVPSYDYVKYNISQNSQNPILIIKAPIFYISVLVKLREQVYGSRDAACRFYFGPRKQYQEASDKKDKDVEAVKTLHLQEPEP